MIFNQKIINFHLLILLIYIHNIYYTQLILQIIDVLMDLILHCFNVRYVNTQHLIKVCKRIRACHVWPCVILIKIFALTDGTIIYFHPSSYCLNVELKRSYNFIEMSLKLLGKWHRVAYNEKPNMSDLGQIKSPRSGADLATPVFRPSCPMSARSAPDMTQTWRANSARSGPDRVCCLGTVTTSMPYKTQNFS